MTRPANTPWLTPYLTVSDARRALSFYQNAFGFSAGNVVDENGVPTHAEMHYKGELIVMFAPEGAWGSTARTPRATGIECPQTFYLYCDDVDAMHQRAVAAGATSLMAPADQFWGDRYCMVEDPDGYRWGFARPVDSAAASQSAPPEAA